MTDEQIFAAIRRADAAYNRYWQINAKRTAGVSWTGEDNTEWIEAYNELTAAREAFAKLKENICGA